MPSSSRPAEDAGDKPIDPVDGTLAIAPRTVELSASNGAVAQQAFKVELTAPDGPVSDVTARATFQVDGDFGTVTAGVLTTRGFAGRSGSSRPARPWCSSGTRSRSGT